MSSHFPARRLLSITAIGIYMLFGACLMPINIYFAKRVPAFLMGIGFTGWKAVVFFLAMAALDAAIGIGLLRLAAWSRMAAIYFFVFRMANLFVTFSFPAGRARFEEGISVVRGALGGSGTRRSPNWFGPVFELALMGLVLWILLTRKEVFPGRFQGATASAPPVERDIQ
jgi:hypothetical protein